MKKSCVFLFVMSIISLLLAVFEAVYSIRWLYEYTRFKATYLICGFVVFFLVFFLPGLFGIIGSIKRGHFTVVCIVLGGLFTLYVLASALAACIFNGSNGIYYINLGPVIARYAVEAIFFALYTSAAAVAFKFRKAV